jgi:flagellar biosynthesis/type III secretory pathway chaperone
MSEVVSAPVDIADSLAIEVAGYRSLLALLLAEQEALRAADADTLARVAQRKLTQVYALQDIGRTRVEKIRGAGFRSSPEGMSAVLDACPKPERARAQWDALTSLVAEAQRHNAVNARMASVQQRHVDRAMAALWTAAGRESTYGADGRSRHFTASRSLVES